MSQDLFGAMSVSASGMSAQRKRMDAIAQNLANSETTRAADGEPYKRHTVVFRSNETPAPASGHCTFKVAATRTDGSTIESHGLPVARVSGIRYKDGTRTGAPRCDRGQLE